MYIIIIDCLGEEVSYWSGSFSHDVSMPPASLRFDRESEPSTSSLLSAVVPPPSPTPSSQSPTPHSPVPKRRMSTTSPDPYQGGGGGGGGRENNYRHSLYASSDSQLMDWESGSMHYSYQEGADGEQPLTLSSIMNQSEEPLSLMPLTSIPPSLYLEEEEDDAYRAEREVLGDASRLPFDSPDLGGGDELLDTEDLHPLPALRDSGGWGSKKLKRKSAHVNFASIPTNPRDWVVMDALQEEIKHWKLLGLYIIGEKSSLTNIPSDLYPNCTLLPVEVSGRVRSITIVH